MAGFLGASNLLRGHGRWTAGDLLVVILDDGTPIRVPRAVLASETVIEVGVRPEKIRIQPASEDSPSGINQLSATIREVAYLGVSTSYLVETAAGTELTVHEQNVAFTTRSDLLRPGQVIRLTWSPPHAFIVPAGDGSA